MTCRYRRNRRPLVALLTDFGNSEYAGVLHGVLLRQDRRVRIIDLCHRVAPQNIIEGAWILQESAPFFPRGTVFLAVVDPGVGSSRKILAARGRNFSYVGPDNGLLAPALSRDGNVRVRELIIPQGASTTFHGRDVMAPAAGWLARGSWPPLSRPLENWTLLDLKWQSGAAILVKIDRFGNLVTNRPGPAGAGGQWRLKISSGEEWLLQHYRSYAEAAGDLFLVTGSSGTLEISRRNGSAAAVLPELHVGQRLDLQSLDPLR